jgi:hypothetical protein
MGYLPKEAIQKAGEQILSVLKTEPKIKFSRFYNEQTAQGDPVPFVALDCAVSQLEYDGHVAIVRDLPELLPDGEPDYQITLTKSGLARLNSGVLPAFVAMDL